MKKILVFLSLFFGCYSLTYEQTPLKFFNHDFFKHNEFNLESITEDSWIKYQLKLLGGENDIWITNEIISNNKKIRIGYFQTPENITINKTTLGMIKIGDSLLLEMSTTPRDEGYKKHIYKLGDGKIVVSSKIFENGTLREEKNIFPYNGKELPTPFYLLRILGDIHNSDQDTSLPLIIDGMFSESIKIKVEENKVYGNVKQVLNGIFQSAFHGVIVYYSDDKLPDSVRIKLTLPIFGYVPGLKNICDIFVEDGKAYRKHTKF